jgi:hypothetical protein
MTVEQCANDPAIQHAGKCLMMGLGMPLRDKLIAFDKTSNAQTFLVLWPAAKADPVR